jgi:hypothetical protein
MRQSVQRGGALRGAEAAAHVVHDVRRGRVAGQEDARVPPAHGPPVDKGGEADAVDLVAAVVGGEQRGHKVLVGDAEVADALARAPARELHV